MFSDRTNWIQRNVLRAKTLVKAKKKGKAKLNLGSVGGKLFRKPGKIHKRGIEGKKNEINS